MLSKRVNNLCVQDKKRTENVPSGVPYIATTVRFTKSGSVLPLYKISILVKTRGAGVFIITRKINIVIKATFE